MTADPEKNLQIFSDDGSLTTGNYKWVSMFGGRFDINPIDGLDQRAIKVMTLGALGLNGADTAHVLRVSPATVKNNRKALFQLIGAKNITHAVKECFDQDVFRIIEPAILPSSLEVDMDFVYKMATGSAYTELVEPPYASVDQVKTHAYRMQRALGFKSFPGVVTALYMAQVLESPSLNNQYQLMTDELGLSDGLGDS